MSIRQDKAQVEQLQTELKVARKGYMTSLRAHDFRLLKLTAVMVILALLSAIIHGRI